MEGAEAHKDGRIDVWFIGGHQPGDVARMARNRDLPAALDQIEQGRELGLGFIGSDRF